MNHCGLTLPAIKFVARGIKYNTALKTLGLGENNFTDPMCLKYLMEALLRNKTKT